MHTFILSLFLAFNTSTVAPDKVTRRKIDRKYLCQHWMAVPGKRRSKVWVYRVPETKKDKSSFWYGREHRITISTDARLRWFRPIGCSRDRPPYYTYYSWEWKTKKDGTVLFILNGYIRYEVVKLTKNTLKLKSVS